MGILGDIGTLGAGILPAIGQKKRQKRAFEQQKKLNAMQYQHDVDMWNMANQYNSPAEQMKRYRAAGLNPNLVAGSSTGAGNAAQTMPQYQAQATSEDTPRNVDPMKILQALSLYQDVKKKQVEQDSIKTLTDLNYQKTLSEVHNTTLIHNRSQKELGEASLYYNKKGQIGGLAHKLRQSQVSALEHNIRKLKLENQWLEKGVTPRDSLPVRVFGRYLEKALSKINWQQFWK